MAFYDGEIDEDLLVEIPCEFCNDLFPILFLTEHQTGCRYDLVRITEPTVEEIEEEFAEQEENESDPELFEDATQILDTQPDSNNTSTTNEHIQVRSEGTTNENIKETQVNKGSGFMARILQYFQSPLESKDSLPKEESFVKESSKKNQSEQSFCEYEVLEEDLLEEYETSTLGFIKNKEKRIDEKSSFKMPTNPILKNGDYKSFIHNDLPDSDNEDTESLEQLWAKAKIKLAQRSRALEGKIML